MQGDKTVARHQDSSASDKLITAYLSRQSGANKPSQGFAARQPLAALENLQEALSELHLAYDLSKSAVMSTSQPLNACNNGQTAGSSTTKFRPSGKRQGLHHRIVDLPAQQQSAMRQSEPNQGYPSSKIHNVPLVGVHIDASDPAGRPCQRDSAEFAAADGAAEPSTPLQPGSRCQAQNRAEQSAQSMTSTCGSSVGMDLLTSAPAVQLPLAALTQTNLKDSPTAYLTPHAIDPSPNELAWSCQSPSPEHWYTPMSTANSASNAASNHTAGLAEHTSSPGHSIRRADSPSLLYGWGSAFSTDLLGQENEVSSHWLTQ